MGAGSDPDGAILVGLSMRAFFFVRGGEVVLSARTYDDAGNQTALNPFPVDFGSWAADLLVGVDTNTGGRNHLEWVTNLGVTARQFYVRDLPASGSLYVNNQEAQGGIAVVKCNPAATDPMGRVACLAINVLPNFNDEFFDQQAYSGNRYANTRRNWGGAQTAEVKIDGATVVDERNVHTLFSYFWLPSALGTHPMVVRLRAGRLSAHHVDIPGTLSVVLP